MPAEILLKVIDRWPQAILILSSEGNILAMNRRVNWPRNRQGSTPGRPSPEITSGRPSRLPPISGGVPGPPIQSSARSR